MNEDLREILFNKYQKDGWSGDASAVGEEDTKLMLDEYWEKRGKELLQWMAKHNVDCRHYTDQEPCFWYHGERLNKDQIFENFL